MGNSLGSDKHDIKANSHPLIFSMGKKEILSGFNDPPLFFLIDPIEQLLDRIGRPGLHFDEYDGLPIQGNQIDLPRWGTYIPGDDTHPRGF
jgi:hypothetical protein